MPREAWIDQAWPNAPFRVRQFGEDDDEIETVAEFATRAQAELYIDELADSDTDGSSSD